MVDSAVEVDPDPRGSKARRFQGFGPGVTTANTSRWMPRKNHGPTCEVPSCGRPVHSRGYCASHYRQLLRGRTPSRPIRPRGLGEKPVLAVRIPARLIAAMDRKLRRAGLTRAELMEGLLSRWVGRAAS